MVSASNIHKYLYVSFYPNILIFLDSVVRVLPSYVVSRFKLLTWHIFLYQLPYGISWQFIITACIRVSIFLFLFWKQFDVVHVHKVVDLFLRFTEFVITCEFPKNVVECQRISLEYVSQDIYNYKAFSSYRQFLFPGFHSFLDKPYDFDGYLIHFQYPVLGDQILNEISNQWWFTVSPTFAGSISWESDWYQISSRLQVSSQFSNWY